MADEPRQGALRFAREPGGEFVSSGVLAPVGQVTSLQEDAARVAQGSADRDTLRRLLPGSSSQGGRGRCQLDHLPARRRRPRAQPRVPPPGRGLGARPLFDLAPYPFEADGTPLDASGTPRSLEALVDLDWGLPRGEVVARATRIVQVARRAWRTASQTVGVEEGLAVACETFMESAVDFATLLDGDEPRFNEVCHCAGNLHVWSFSSSP